MAQRHRTISQPKAAPTRARRLSLTEQVYQSLKEEILQVGRQPGELLLESELAERYGISKTPVREALRLLVQDGWVTVLPRKGYIVQPLILPDVREVFLLREMIEPGLAAEAAKRINAARVAELQELVKSQVDAGNDIDTALRAAQRFHLAIAEEAGINRGVRMISTLLDEVRRLHHFMPNVEDHITSTAEIRAHEDLVDALSRHDAATASELMREHLSEVARAMVEAFGGVHQR